MTTTTLSLRWLRMKRHLRSFSDGPRARRDAHRGMAAAGLDRRARPGDWLCPASYDRAA